MYTVFTQNVITLVEALNKDSCSDPTLFEPLYDDESVQHWNWAEKPDFNAKGAAEIMKVHEDWWTTFPDLKVVFKDVIEDGPDKSAIRLNSTFTSLTTKEEVNQDIMLYMHGKNGKLVECTVFFDATFVMIHGAKSSFK